MHIGVSFNSISKQSKPARFTSTSTLMVNRAPIIFQYAWAVKTKMNAGGLDCPRIPEYRAPKRLIHQSIERLPTKFPQICDKRFQFNYSVKQNLTVPDRFILVCPHCHHAQTHGKPRGQPKFIPDNPCRI